MSHGGVLSHTPRAPFGQVGGGGLPVRPGAITRLPAEMQGTWTTWSMPASTAFQSPDFKGERPNCPRGIRQGRTMLPFMQHACDILAPPVSLVRP